jgi:hypothetical protein
MLYFTPYILVALIFYVILMEFYFDISIVDPVNLI